MNFYQLQAAGVMPVVNDEYEHLSRDCAAMAELMSDISEATVSAGWNNGLEYALWDAAFSGNLDYGRGIDPKQLDAVWCWALKTGCWIVYALDDMPDGTGGMYAISLNAWNRHLTERKAI